MGVTGVTGLTGVGVAALVAIVTFLSIRLNIVDIDLSGHFEYFKFQSLYLICVAGSYL